ncbi:response regulator [Granulosicoccus antarcticus]|uniref:Response regulator rcp1 n=1 Tax=Granulosicoccus antarcticus IMCC3135 TaxID=1192854 RepID=A0A2Z2NNW1_9GAMM|nr:response regulator [Granulosicoccus antarcticus]ASJ73106.1 Response regulator rcp1 [Granulosicoccus antarcticus IMCC3135]
MSTKAHDLVLLVEDSDIDADLLQRVFRRLKPDVKIMRSEDGIDALDTLENFRPDLIIMDIRMPRMGGLETLELIKQDLRLRSIPVIMMSSSKDQNDISDSYNRQANAYIVKSFDPRDGNKMENLVRFWLETAELDN